MKTLTFRAPCACPAAHGVAAAVLCLASAAAGAQTQNQLPDVVVTATRFAESAAPLPFGVSVITAQDIRQAGVGTVNEALIKLLGVVGRQDFYGGGDYVLDLRGFGATADNNQAVILDGIRLNEADLGGTRLAGIPIDSVARIEVLRGSGAVLYGEGATGGVIVITTQAGQDQARRNSAALYAGLGSHRLRELRGSTTLVTGDFSFDAAVHQRDSDNHRDNFQSKTDGMTLGGQWSPSNLRLGLRYAQDALDTGLPGALSNAQFAANPRQTNTPNDRASIDNARTSAFAELTLGNWQLAADLGQRSKSLDSNQSGFAFAYEIDASHYALRARHDARFGTLHNVLVVGTDYGRWEREVLGVFGSLAEQTSRALYVKDDLSLPGGTRVSVGLRTEKIDKAITTAPSLGGRQQAFELGLSQALGSSATVWGRAGRSFRLANVDEFSFTNPALDIRPQTARDLEVGLRWAQSAYQLEARLYRSNLTDEIGFDPAGNGPFGPASGANINFDRTRRQGAELEAAWAASRMLNLRANLALRKATFRSGPNAGQDIPLVPQQSLSLRADWQPAAGHRLSGGVNWVGSQHPDLANQCNIPRYAVADLRYAYQWRNVELAVNLNNLFDRQYFTQAFACAGSSATSLYPEAGRTAMVSARVGF